MRFVLYSGKVMVGAGFWMLDTGFLRYREENILNCSLHNNSKY